MIQSEVLKAILLKYNFWIEKSVRHDIPILNLLFSRNGTYHPRITGYTDARPLPVVQTEAITEDILYEYIEIFHERLRDNTAAIPPKFTGFRYVNIKG